jgi:diguanylate cyclase (GGDEF)-like protein
MIMNLQFSWVLIPSALAGIFSLISAWILWTRRSSHGAIYLAYLFIATAIWSIFYTFELAAADFTISKYWLQAEYLGIVMVPVFWLLFCLRYSNIRRPDTQTFIILFSIIPLATLGFVLTNDLHQLLWAEISLISRYGINILALEYGSWFWVHIFYSLALYISGLYFLVQSYFKTPGIMRRQIRLILFAGFIPGVANILYLTESNPIPPIDIISLSFALSGMLILFTIFYYRFQDILPIARETTIENMRDGIIVVDLQDRIVDINPAAEKVIQATFSEVVGKKSSQVLSDLADWISDSKDHRTPVKVLTYGEGQYKQIFVLNLYPLSDSHDELIGHTIVFHNNTESQKLNKDLKDQADRLSVLYDIGRAITGTLDIDDLLELIYNQLSRVISSDAYFVALYQSKDHKLDIRVLFDQGKRYPSEIVDANDGLSSWIVDHQKPLLIHDLPKEMDGLPVKPIMVGDKQLSRSWLGVPMQIENELIGLLAVASYSPNMFNKSDQLLLEQIAQQAALSIQNARNYQEVIRQANLDSLTGVSNHNHFLEMLYHESESALTTLTPLSLIMLDIDYFKEYNDTYGHVIGDEVLRLTVQAMKSHIKKTDTIGRWGGEEFGIILPNATTTQANMVANRIRRTLSELPLFDVEGKTIPKPTISQGIASIPEHTSDPDDLVIIADRALYRAKNKGRDQVAVGIPPEKGSS